MMHTQKQMDAEKGGGWEEPKETPMEVGETKVVVKKTTTEAPRKAPDTSMFSTFLKPPKKEEGTSWGDLGGNGQEGQVLMAFLAPYDFQFQPFVMFSVPYT